MEEVELHQKIEFKEVLEQYKVDFSGKCTKTEIDLLRKLHNAQLYFVYLLHTEVEESTPLSQKCHELASGMHQLLQLYDKENYSREDWFNEAGERRAMQDEVIKSVTDLLYQVNNFETSLHILHDFTDHIVSSKLFDFIDWKVRWFAENQITSLKSEVAKVIAEKIGILPEFKNYFSNPTQAVRELKLEEERRFTEELKKKQQSVQQKKRHVFGFMEWIDEELHNSGDEALEKLATANTYKQTLEISGVENDALRRVEFDLELVDLLSALSSISTRDITFARNATWQTLTFEQLKQLYSKIETAEKMVLQNAQDEKSENNNSGGWLWFFGKNGSDESSIVSTTEQTIPSGIQLAKKDIISLMKACCLIKTDAKKDYLHSKVLAERDRFREEAEREEPEKPKTKYEKFISTLIQLLKNLVGPVLTMFDVVEYLKAKLELNKSLSEEGKPLLKHVDTDDEEQSEVDEVEFKAGFNPSYWNLISPSAKYDNKEKDPDFEGHLLFQNFHELKRGELHPIDKAYSSITARRAFGYFSINAWYKLIFPLYDILFDPKTAIKRGESVGLPLVLTNPLLPLAMLGAIWHQPILELKASIYDDKDSTALEKFLVRALEIVSWCGRAPLLAGAIAINAVFVAAALLIAAALVVALTLACIGLSLATVMIAAPVILVGGIIELGKSVFPDKKPQLILADSPLNDGQEDKEVRGDDFALEVVGNNNNK